MTVGGKGLRGKVACFAVVGFALALSFLSCPVGARALSASAAPPAVTLTSPHTFQVFQRTSARSGGIFVAGRLRRLRGAVQVRWGHRPWRTVPCDAKGRFHVRLYRQPVGQATLYVRSQRRHAVWAQRKLVSVGDIYVIAGQSNASGRSPRLSVCSWGGIVPGMFANDDRWRRLRDPVDSRAHQVDLVSSDFYAAGSIWPLVAQELLRVEPVPLAFVPCAKGSSGIRRWLPQAGARRSRVTLYGSMLRRIGAVGGRVRAVLYWQGEADARASMPGDVYGAALRRLGRALRKDCGAPLVAVQIGDYRTDWYTGPGIDAIRLAQQDAWGTDNIVAGPVLYDIDLSGEVHFMEADDMRLAARRWTACIVSGVLQEQPVASPRLRAATYDGDLTVTLAVDPGPWPLVPEPVSGIVVRTEGEDVPVTAEIAGADGVTITLAGPVVTPLTVSLGSARTSAGAQIPAESSTWRLPMAMFVDAPVGSPAE